MGKYSENEFLYARPIAHNLITDAGFRRWFLAGTKLADIAENAQSLIQQQAALRTTDNAKRWPWFNYFCPKDGRCECKIETGIETDILLNFRANNAIAFAVHVEIKPPGKDLQPGQAESYPRRAACWANPLSRPGPVLAYDEYATVIVCGTNLDGDARLRKFDKTLFHSQIAQHISPYPDEVDFRTPQMP